MKQKTSKRKGWLYRKIEESLYVNGQSHIVSSLSLSMLATLTMTLHIGFFIVFTITDVPEMAVMNFSSAVFYLLVLYVVLVKGKLLLACYLLIISFIVYVLWCSYFLGYEKHSVVILPVITLCMYSIYELNKRDLSIISGLIFLSYVAILYFRKKAPPIYENEIMYVEYVNVAISFFVCLFVLHTKSLSRYYLEHLDQQKIESLSKEANMDFLTGLWNRRYASEMFNKGNCPPNSTVVLSDIDFFKKINDTYGHNAGDYILNQVSLIFINTFRSSDLICRWGGEEFLFILQGNDKKAIFDKLEKTRASIEDSYFSYNNQEIQVTISFGVNHAISDGMKLEKAVSLADNALYYAKENGRNQIVFYDNIKTGSVIN